MPIGNEKPEAKVGTAPPSHPSAPLGVDRSSAAPLPCNLLPSPPSYGERPLATGQQLDVRRSPERQALGGEGSAREGRAGLGTSTGSARAGVGRGGRAEAGQGEGRGQLWAGSRARPPALKMERRRGLAGEGARR